jgi:glutamate/tyrosine decarboxylase-like PLP-dependent enzyme
MLGLKKLFHSAVHSALWRNTQKNVFPEKGIGLYPTKALLRLLSFDIALQSQHYQFGKLIAPSDDVAAFAWNVFLKQNPNQMGNWSQKSSSFDVFQKAEHNAVHAFISLLHGNHSSTEGYITSGATEGNIFSLWTGREYLRHAYPKERVCVLLSDLTHYSIQKAADITGIPVVQIPLSSSGWSLDPQVLHVGIRRARKAGYGAFLLPFTLGYTLTGTNDDHKGICHYLSERPDIHIYCWIDAALNGMTLPFINSSFRPFKNPYVHSFVVDAHKFGGAPYPSGLVLYRSSLKKHIERFVPYIPQTDSTVLGSRPGMSAIALWALILSKGRREYQKQIAVCLAQKRYFIEKILCCFPKTEIVTDNDSITCGVIFHSFPQQKIPVLIERTFGLWAISQTYHFIEKNRKLRVYKFHFLPHCPKQEIDALCAHLVSSRN